MTRKSLLLACGIASALFGPVYAAQAETPVEGQQAVAPSDPNVPEAKPAENLVQVYQAAARSDPTVREAEARRLAALEAKPQARGLLFPQININGQYANRQTDGQSTFPQAVDFPVHGR